MKKETLIVITVVFICVGCMSFTESNKEIVEMAHEDTIEPLNRSRTMQVSKVNRDDGKRLKRLFIPGKGVAGILLGDTRDEIIRLIGNPKDSYIYRSPCEEYEELVFWNTKTLGDNFSVFLRNNVVFKIRAHNSFSFATEDGITFNTSEDEFLRKYKQKSNLEKFTLFYRFADFVYNFPTYWVDQENGIAFEVFAVNSDIKLIRKIKAIEIFDPSSPFFPEGCLADINKFVPDK
jgi:hypothetical protein